MCNIRGRQPHATASPAGPEPDKTTNGPAGGLYKLKNLNSIALLGK